MLRRFALAGVLVAVVMCAGCAKTAYWTKPGGNQDVFDQTLAMCHNQAFMLPDVQPRTVPQSYSVNTSIVGNTAYSNVTPYYSPYQSMAEGLNQLEAGFANIAQREMFVQRCLIANGWKRVDESKVSVTVDAYAVRGIDRAEYTGSATGHTDGTGTIKVQDKHGAICVGNFRYKDSKNGTGLIRCDDGRSAEISFTALSMTSGYGQGVSKEGEKVIFTFGMSKEESQPYLAAQRTSPKN